MSAAARHFMLQHTKSITMRVAEPGTATRLRASCRWACATCSGNAVTPFSPIEANNIQDAGLCDAGFRCSRELADDGEGFVHTCAQIPSFTILLTGTNQLR